MIVLSPSGADGVNCPKAVSESGMAIAMPALSIRQPWATLITLGFKDIENRSWRTNFRGRFYVHAGAAFDESTYQLALDTAKSAGVPADVLATLTHELPRGGIIGSVELQDCIPASNSPWYIAGNWGFKLANALALPFQPVRGQLNFFRPQLPATGDSGH